MPVEQPESVRYAITNFSSTLLSPGSSRATTPLRAEWLRSLRRWADDGIAFVQLREKTLSAADLLTLAQQGVELLRNLSLPTVPRLLLNGRPDVAVGAGADGVHLPSGPRELQPEQVRALFRRRGRDCVISRSCHTLAEIASARREGCDLALFGPIFGKQVEGHRVQEGVGLDALRLACELAAPMPVLALGGVGAGDVAACRTAGAVGVAGIRLFRTAVPG